MSEIYSINQLLDICKYCGLYQILITVTFALQWITTIFFIIGPVILYQTPEFYCIDSNKLCQEQQACKQNYRIANPEINSLSYQFKLYCDGSWLRSYAQSNPQLGGIIGSLVMAYIADNYGRKIAINYGWILTTIVIIVQTIFTEINTILISQFIIGALASGTTSIHFLYMNEVSNQKYSQIFLFILLLMFPVGAMLMVLLFQQFQDWRSMMFYVVIPTSIVGNFSWFILHESPRFSLIYNKEQEIKQSLKYIAQFNNTKIPEHYTIQELQEGNQKKQNYQEVSFSALLIYKSIRSQILAGCLAFFALAMVYTGINFSLEELGSNLYSSMVYTECADLIGFLLYLLTQNYARKPISILLMVVTIVSSFYTIFNPHIELIFFIKLSISLLFVQFQIICPEIYPTQCRGLAMGVLITFALLGGVASPFAVQFCLDKGFTPFIMLTIVGTLGLVGLISVKETHGVPIEDIIEELK